ncbi:hypothetical protein AYL99_11591 [Fonsecaea erecta]|uniref:Uncharacterized protein n=1 Tax=Fonsecaea erecta TaxID=1367422 RepID=A0A178Z2V6_9EURO|nr:hypothetical protein AYL99_11591 [Fonsecaea erecta]OAP54057.1 hypothetical protein AYL99_11591 [Fonsecaea erecta]
MRQRDCATRFAGRIHGETIRCSLALFVRRIDRFLFRTAILSCLCLYDEDTDEDEDEDEDNDDESESYAATADAELPEEKQEEEEEEDDSGEEFYLETRPGYPRHPLQSRANDSPTVRLK